MSTLFVSHSSDDRHSAQVLKGQLAHRGHGALFLDFDPDLGISAGQDWEQTIYDRLRAASHVVVLWTPGAAKSKWVFAELAIARSLGKNVVCASIGTKAAPPDIIRHTHVLQIDPARLDFSPVVDALERLNLRPRSAPTRFHSPYPGLTTFREEDAGYFFGREDEVEDVTEILHSILTQGLPGMVLITGQAGCGKSSLLRAGVCPALRHRGELLVVEPFRPGSRALVNLARAWAKTLTARGHSRQSREYADVFAAAAQQDTDPAYEWLDRDLDATACTAVAILVDQLEEVLGLDDRAAPSQPFVRMLGRLLERSMTHHDVIVLGTLRSDFIGDFLATLEQCRTDREPRADQPAPVQPRLWYLDRPSSHGLRASIEQPALLCNGRFEPKLVETLLQDAGPEPSLPLVAFALAKLWPQRDSTTGTVRATVYEPGTLPRLLAQSAAPIWSSLVNTPAEPAVRRAFLAMARTVDGRTQRRPIRESDHPEAKAYLQRFVSARLLVARAEGDGAGRQGRRVLELAHDVLFEQWEPLKRWIGEQYEFLAWRSNLVDRMRIAGESGQKPGDALQGTALSMARTWLKSSSDLLLPAERKFVEQATRTARIRNAVPVAAAVLACLVLLGSWIRAQNARRHADAARGAAEISAHQATEGAREEARARQVAERATWEARTQHLVATQTTHIPLDGEAQAVVSNGAQVWVAVDSKQGSLAHFSPGDLNAIEYLDGGSIDDLLATKEHVWVLDRASRTIVRFDGPRPVRVPLPGPPTAMTAGSRSAPLVATETDQGDQHFRLAFVEPDDISRSADAALGSPDSAPQPPHLPQKARLPLILRAAGSTWAASPAREALYRVAGKNHDREEFVVAKGKGVVDVEWDGKRFWVARGDSILSILHPDTGDVSTLRTEVEIESVFWDGRTLWAYSPGRGKLLAFDGGPASTPRVASIPQVVIRSPLVSQRKGQVSISVYRRGETPKSLSFGDLSAAQRMLASDGTYLYVISEAGQLYRLPLLSFAVGAGVSALAASNRHVWLAGRQHNAVSRYTFDGRFSGQYPLEDPSALAFNSEGLWVASAALQQVTVLDPQTGKARRKASLPGKPGSLVATAQGAAISDAAHPKVYVLGPMATNAVSNARDVQEVSLDRYGEKVVALAAQERTAWAMLETEGNPPEQRQWTVVGIDLASRKVVQEGRFVRDPRVPPSRKPTATPALGKARHVDFATVRRATPEESRAWAGNENALAFDPVTGCLWGLFHGSEIACLDPGPEIRLRCASRSVLPSVAIGSGTPVDLAVGGRALWVSDTRSGTIRPMLLHKRLDYELTAGPPVLFPTGMWALPAGEVMGNPVTSKVISAHGDLWVLHGGSESVTRIMLSSFGGAILPKGGCASSTSPTWTLAWRSEAALVPHAKRDAELRVPLTPGRVPPEGRLSIEVEYSGTEPRREFGAVFRDNAGSTGKLPFTLGNCRRQTVSLDVGTLAKRRLKVAGLTDLILRVAGVTEREQGELRVFKVEGADVSSTEPAQQPDRP